MAPVHTRAAAAGHLAAVAAVLGGCAAADGPRAWAVLLAPLGPLAVLLIAGRHDAFVRRHAVAALGFNASLALYLAALLAVVRLVAGPYTVQLVPFAFFISLVAAFNWLVFSAIGAQRAATGQLFTYPMTLRLFRRQGAH